MAEDSMNFAANFQSSSSYLFINYNREVVVVSVNYRLGPLGFLSLGNEQALLVGVILATITIPHNHQHKVNPPSQSPTQSQEVKS